LFFYRYFIPNGQCHLVKEDMIEIHPVGMKYR
jgi:hypothetical protein